MTWFSDMFVPKKAKQLPLFLYNTLGKEKQEFKLPPGVKTVRMYNCGPTVYGVQHIGNLSMFVFADILRHTLEYNGFTVKQVINFTDFGHLSGDNAGDADQGEDRMMKGLKRDGLEVTMENMRAMAEKYASVFLADIGRLSIDTTKITFPRASDYIQAQIAMIQTLEEKSYAYKASDGVYFDTSRFPEYGALGDMNLQGNKGGARVAMISDKRGPSDFALWKFSDDAVLGWDSPWGRGFPGWHIECSAMIRKTLGEQIDIHTGGIEHIAIHHNNEIAQSECCTGRKPFCRFWLHRAHLQLDGAKFAKSENRVTYLSEIIERGFHPLAFRYLLLGSHYRTGANFTWEALEAAQTAFLRIRQTIDAIPDAPTTPPEQYRARWHHCFNDDLDTPGALAVLWDMIKDTKHVSPAELKAGIIDIDRVFGLGFAEPDLLATSLYKAQFGILVDPDELPQHIQQLIEQRTKARETHDWPTADKLRTEIEQHGYALEDAEQGVRVFKKS